MECNKRIRISSSWSVLFKFIFPAIWMTGFGSSMIIYITNHGFEQDGLLSAAVLLSAIAAIYWLFLRFKKVVMVMIIFRIWRSSNVHANGSSVSIFFISSDSR